MSYRNLKPVNDNTKPSSVNRIGGYAAAGIIVAAGISTIVAIVIKAIN